MGLAATTWSVGAPGAGTEGLIRSLAPSAIAGTTSKAEGATTPSSAVGSRQVATAT